jgi:predicted transposase/invertase (TIGR01784 family)
MSKTNPYFDPKNDMLFKRVFGEHENLLRSFLNAMLPLPEDAPIVSLEYLTPEQVPEVPGLFKNSIVDVKCKDSTGRIFIVEMQILWSPSFQQRMIFNGSKAYVKQLKVGMPYSDLRPVYALALINGIFDKNTDDFYHHYQIVNLENTTKKLEGLEFVFVELPKFKAKTPVDKRMQAKWLRFLSEVNENTQTLDAELMDDADIASALDLVKVAKLTEAEIAAYHDREDKVRIELSIHADLERGRVEGKAEGKAEGLVEGRHAGALEIAKHLLAAGMAAQSVAAATQLSLDDVKRLKN